MSISKRSANNNIQRAGLAAGLEILMSCPKPLPNKITEDEVKK